MPKKASKLQSPAYTETPISKGEEPDFAKGKIKSPARGTENVGGADLGLGKGEKGSKLGTGEKK